jgi:thiol-disulfide isomerase/thioredoxin
MHLRRIQASGPALAAGIWAALLAISLGGAGPVPAGRVSDPGLSDSSVAVTPIDTLAAGFVTFESAKGMLLLGEVTRQDILSRFPEWDQEYAAYAPDSQEVARLRSVSEPVDILCVMGTWCDDSRREVPRFWKVLDVTGDSGLSLRMLAVGRLADAEVTAPLLRSLSLPEDLRAEYDVELVPTFIFRRNGQELGRIVEAPQASLEADAAEILSAGNEPDTRSSWR